jgi:hypothetical protein
MNTRHFAAAVVLALAVPLCLAVIPWFVRSSSSTLGLLALNWLYMAAPQLLVTLLGLLSVRFRAFATVPLVLLTLLVVGFQAWVWWWVPAREGGLAWVVYFPLAVVVVLLGLFAQLGARERSTSAP